MTHYTEVKKICDELQDSGKPVSLDYLLNQLPDAQASVVVHYQKWRNEQAKNASTPSSGTLSSTFLAAVEHEIASIVKAQTDQANQQLQQALQAEILAAEHNSQLQQQISSLQQRQSELEVSQHKQQEQLSTQAAKYASLLAERDNAISLNLNLQQELSTTKQQYQELQNLQTSTQQSLLQHQITIASLQDQLTQAEQTKQQAQQEIQNLNLKLTGLQHSLDALNNQLSTEKSQTNQNLAELKSALALSEQQLEPLKAQVQEYQEKIALLQDIKQSEENLKIELETTKQDYHTLKQNFQVREHDVTELNAMIETLESKLHLATKTETQAIALNKRLQAQLEQALNATDQLNSIPQSNSAELYSLKAERDNLATQLHSLKQNMQLLQNQQQQIIAERDNALNAAKAQVNAQPLDQFKAQLESQFEKEKQFFEQKLSEQARQLQELEKTLAQATQEAQEQRNLAKSLSAKFEAMQNFKPTQNQSESELMHTVAQLKANNELLREQSAISADHQVEQREIIKQLRDELQQQRDAMTLMQQEQMKLQKQKQQLDQQVNFVKENATATIERLTRYREQAQERIEQLEQQLSYQKT